jgi:hypothetical protein
MSFFLNITGGTAAALKAAVLEAAAAYGDTTTTTPQSPPAGSAGSAASTPTSSAASTPAPTLDEVRAALQPLLRDETKKDKVTALIAAAGATRISLVDPSKYQEILDGAAKLGAAA